MTAEYSVIPRLLDSEGTEYKGVEGPFTLLPSSLLEDLIQVQESPLCVENIAVQPV